MGIRETLNEKSHITTVLALIVIVGFVLLIIWQLTSNGGRSDAAFADFYSVDEGQTYFVHTSEELPPFDYEGEIAHRAAVFQCDGDGGGGGNEPFVGYLQRFTEEAQRRMTEYRDNDMTYGRALDALSREPGERGIEVKAIGGEEWHPIMSPEGQEIINNIECPDGDGGTPRPVTP